MREDIKIIIHHHQTSSDISLIQIFNHSKNN